MNKNTRLIFLLISLVTLVVIGYLITNSFSFFLYDFWFTSGLFLLVLLSLIDQPYFSKDSNIFINGVTSWMSLLLVTAAYRNITWWLFFSWSSYLIISSYTLIWLRNKSLIEETAIVQLISRLNRIIGRPEAIFSAFFLWGVIRKFGIDSGQANALFLYWAIFMLLDIPAFATFLGKISWAKAKNIQFIGLLKSIQNPSVANVELFPSVPLDVIGRRVSLIKQGNVEVCKGVILDDRILAGTRIAKVALQYFMDPEVLLSDQGNPIQLIFDESQKNADETGVPISTVDTGSNIGKIEFYVNPLTDLQEGEVLWVEKHGEVKAFYQVVSGHITQESSDNNNSIQSVRVAASQLGIWNKDRSRFEPVTWVAQAGNLINKTTAKALGSISIPKGHLQVGHVPNSAFPVHVNIQDLVTHNTAIIGVTGCGKSYLAFHLIESLAANKIKVMILDMSRQHWLFLQALKPVALKAASEIPSWYADKENYVGIYQYAVEGKTSPIVTTEFVEKAFEQVSKTKLKAGENEPAKLCVVFEEAHSLIPEWNQVSNKEEVDYVNKTARIILQGRKYGMGSIIIAQRTANVTKSILNQCNTMFALQSFDQTGLDFLKNYMGEEYAHTISTLPIRHAILVGKASSSTRPILFQIEDLSAKWKTETTEKPAS